MSRAWRNVTRPVPVLYDMTVLEKFDPDPGPISSSRDHRMSFCTKLLPQETEPSLVNMHLSRLEKLPQEVRDQIYRNIFPCDEILVPGVRYTCGPIDTCPPPSPLDIRIVSSFPSLALLQVNRRIATEAAMVLFERNRCQFRMPPIHVCSHGRCTNRNGCTEMQLEEPVEEDNHSCTELGCLPGLKQRHLAQNMLQRYGHQVQHAHLALNSKDLLNHFGIPRHDHFHAKRMASELNENHKTCKLRVACKTSYIGWRWEGHALRTIASTGLKSMTLDLGDVYDGKVSWSITDVEGPDYQKQAFVRLMQALFRGLRVRQVTFQRFRMDYYAVVVWLNPETETEKGSGWIDSLTVIDLPCQKDTSVFLAGLKQEGQRPAISSADAASLPNNLALSNVKEYDEINTWLK